MYYEYNIMQYIPAKIEPLCFEVRKKFDLKKLKINNFKQWP